MSAYIHDLACCESSHVGAGTRIWAFAHILPEARVGKGCNICDHVFVENDVVIGNAVTVKCGVQLWDGLRVEGQVFIGPNATFTNDPFPRSRNRPDNFARTWLRHGASIGANATILPGIEIGQHAMVGAGSVVTRSVPPYAIVVGNPARIIGYVGDVGKGSSANEGASTGGPEHGATLTSVHGVSLMKLRHAQDLRGSLCVAELEKDIPFKVKRIFTVFDVPSAETRGAHAHKRCEQFLLCVHGNCAVVADDGRRRQEFELSDPTVGIYLPPMTWGIQYKYSHDAVLLVLASELYEDSDYIRDYSEFISMLGEDRAL